MFASLATKVFLASGAMLLLASPAAAAPASEASAPLPTPPQPDMIMEVVDGRTFWIAPSSTSSNANATSSSPLEARANGFCTDSTFSCATSGGSPSTSDCTALANYLQGRNDEWDLTLNQYRVLGSTGTCAFDAKTGYAGTTYIGGQDVVDLIRSSIGRCASGGRVGAQGDVPCPIRGVGTYSKVHWSVFHS